MFALTPAHNRRKDLDACAFRQFHHGIYHLIDRLFLDGTSTLRTMWNSYAGIQQSKIIINSVTVPTVERGFRFVDF